jgi:hypothetical protein
MKSNKMLRAYRLKCSEAEIIKNCHAQMVVTRIQNQSKAEKLNYKKTITEAVDL